VTAEPLVVTTREPADKIRADAPLDARSIENVHYGSIAVVSVDGALVHWAGDPEWPTFTRSTLKPFQALPFIREGGPSRYGWSSRQIALMCASHSGEPMHTEIVSGMLASADCDAACLQCGCHVPGWYAALGRTPPPDAVWSSIQHNCSGKHAGFLAACRLQGESVEDYLAPSSALQRRVIATVAGMSRLAERDIPAGTDGCSAPNFALPLSRLAGLYAQLAQGEAAPAEGDSLGLLFDAMTGHPELVSGSRRSDRALMALAPGDWVTKIGADGVQAIGVRSAGIGIAIKISDGNRDALYRAVVEVIGQLGLVERETDRDAFAPWLRASVQNARGTATGRVLPTFKLRPG
jgi:L-asparaginase II